MRIHEILRLNPDEIGPAYRQLAVIRRVYRRLIRQTDQPTPKTLQDKYRAALVVLDDLETELVGVKQYEDMRALCRHHVGAALRPGRPRNTFALQWLVGELAAIYKGYTDQKPTCYWNDVEGQPGGDFFKLCKVVDDQLSWTVVARSLKAKNW